MVVPTAQLPCLVHIRNGDGTHRSCLHLLAMLPALRTPIFPPNTGCNINCCYSQLQLSAACHPCVNNVVSNYPRTRYVAFHFFVLFFIRAISKLYICIPTNCTQLIYFINNTLKHMYCLKL